MNPAKPPLSLRFSTFLETVLESQLQEACLLKSLSQLEHTGARKIQRNIPWAGVDRDILKHIRDENGHALILWDLGTNLVSQSRPFSTQAAQSYFQTLETAALEVYPQAKDWPQRYHGVTWAIEQRAFWLYPRYIRATRYPWVKKGLEQILEEEKEHRPSAPPRRAFWRQLEESAFEKLLTFWENALIPANSHLPPNNDKLGLPRRQDGASAI